MRSNVGIILECFKYSSAQKEKRKKNNNKIQRNTMSERAAEWTNERATFTCLLEYSICYNFNAWFFSWWCWTKEERERERAIASAKKPFRLNGRPCHITMAYSDFQRSRVELCECVCVFKYAFDFCLYHVYVMSVEQILYGVHVTHQVPQNRIQFTRHEYVSIHLHSTCVCVCECWYICNWRKKS